MPTSKDPEKRARQMANLPNLRGEATATTFAPGEAGALQHGARSRHPQRSPEWSPAVERSIDDLEQRVDVTVRDDAGALQPWAVLSVEAVAIQRVACARLDRYVADQEAKGRLRPETLDLQSKVGERYHRALEREALTLRSRLEAKVAVFDLAKHWATEPVVDGETFDG